MIYSASLFSLYLFIYLFYFFFVFMPFPFFWPLRCIVLRQQSFLQIRRVGCEHPLCVMNEKWQTFLGDSVNQVMTQTVARFIPPTSSIDRPVFSSVIVAIRFHLVTIHPLQIAKKNNTIPPPPPPPKEKDTAIHYCTNLIKRKSILHFMAFEILPL